MQSRHGHDSGFHFLMAFLKFFKESISFKCHGILSHILGPRCLRLSKPWFTVFTCGIINCDLFLKLCWSACLKRKRSFEISGEIPRCTLHISIARVLRFLWCIETDLSLSKRFLKDHFFVIIHVFYLFYYFLCDHDTFKSKDNN